MKRGNLDLAIARIGFLKAAERVLLAEMLDREEDLSVLSQADVERVIGRSLAGKRWDSGAFLAAAERDRQEAERRGIRFEPYVSFRYPPLLRELPDPPTVLFYRGALPDPERPLAAVVGTRDPSAAGARAAYEFGRDFGRCGVAVVSGLARGIDALAHRGNLDAAGATIAVLGSGLDRIVPSSNRELARRVLASGGALVAEYPPLTAAFKHHFPARNRIIAGLSRSLVVVEAPEKSGALISADFAADQGRDLWVASAPLESARAAGTRRLAADGAAAARSAFDVVSDWGLPVPPPEKPKPANETFDRGGFAAAAVRSLEFELESTPTGVRTCR